MIRQSITLKVRLSYLFRVLVVSWAVVSVAEEGENWKTNFILLPLYHSSIRRTQLQYR